MTSATPPPDYRLTHESDGTSYIVRENLVDILERELLGPINGPEELLPVSPRHLYLVGHIAPYKLAAGQPDPERSEDGYGLTGIRADEDAARAQRGCRRTPRWRVRRLRMTTRRTARRSRG